MESVNQLEQDMFEAGWRSFSQRSLPLNHIGVSPDSVATWRRICQQMH
jgi:hypothetical protein